MMSTMTAIIAGSTGLRLLFIDKEYGSIIKSMARDDKRSTSDKKGNKKKNNKHRSNSSPGEDRLERLLNRLKSSKKLADMRGRRASNRRAVVVDGISIIIILGMGFATALELSPSLSMSAAVTFIFFGVTMLSFYRHTHNIFNQSD